MSSATSNRTRAGLVAGITVIAVLAVAVLAARATAGTGDDEHDLTMDLYLVGTDLIRNATNQPGQQNYIAGDLYLVDDNAATASPKGEPVGRAVGQCTVITARERICSGVFNLTGRGVITIQLEVVGGVNQGVAVTGGVGEFAGARGTIIESTVPGQPTDRLNHIELTTLADTADTD